MRVIVLEQTPPLLSECPAVVEYSTSGRNSLPGPPWRETDFHPWHALYPAVHQYTDDFGSCRSTQLVVTQPPDSAAPIRQETASHLQLGCWASGRGEPNQNAGSGLMETSAKPPRRPSSVFASFASSTPSASGPRSLSSHATRIDHQCAAASFFAASCYPHLPATETTPEALPGTNTGVCMLVLRGCLPTREGLCFSLTIL